MDMWVGERELEMKILANERTRGRPKLAWNITIGKEGNFLSNLKEVLGLDIA